MMRLFQLETKMGKIKSYAQSWLDLHGNDLGYDMTNVPSIDHMDTVADNNVHEWKYHGYESEKDYYRSQPL